MPGEPKGQRGKDWSRLGNKKEVRKSKGRLEKEQTEWIREKTNQEHKVLERVPR